MELDALSYYKKIFQDDENYYDEKQLKTAVAMHRETWYALSKIKNDKRYAEYIDRISDADLEGGIYMDATLDYVEKRGEKRGLSPSFLF